MEEIREPVKFPEGEVPLTDGNPATADCVAEPILFLASAAESFITVIEVLFDRGESLLQG